MDNKKSNAYSFPSNKLTVIIRDDSPLIFTDSPPAFRSVQIELTEEQVIALMLKHTGTSGATQYFETIAQCFIEPNE